MTSEFQFKPSTRQIGYTDGLRAVWQNENGKPFIAGHDAKGQLFTSEVSEFSQIDGKTWGELNQKSNS